MITLCAPSRSTVALFLGLCSIVGGCGAETAERSSTPSATPTSPAAPPAPPGLPPSAPGAADCRLSVQVLSEAGRGALGIALDDGHVYLKVPAGVYAVPKTGGQLTRFDGVPPSFPRSDRLTVGGYEYSLQEGGLFRVAGDGGRLQLASVESVEAECFAITQSQGVLYWTGADGIVMSVEASGGFPLFVAGAGASDCDDDYTGLAVAADETGVYWIAGQPRRRSSDDDSLLLYKTCR
jgi:hypothetical protein